MAYSEVVRRPAEGRQLEGWGGSRRHPGCGGPELEGAVVKAGWWVLRRDPADRASMWPYLPLRFALPRHLYMEEMDIRCQARDVERKSRDHLRMSSYWVWKMPPLHDLPMPWRLGESEDKKFWKGQNIATGGDLGLGHPSPGVQLEEAGQRIPWMPALELAEEGSPLPPLGPGPMEVDSTN